MDRLARWLTRVLEGALVAALRSTQAAQVKAQAFRLDLLQKRVGHLEVELRTEQERLGAWQEMYRRLAVTMAVHALTRHSGVLIVDHADIQAWDGQGIPKADVEQTETKTIARFRPPPPKSDQPAAGAES